MSHMNKKEELGSLFFFRIVSNFNIMKILTLLVHTALGYVGISADNPSNSDMDPYRLFTCIMLRD